MRGIEYTTAASARDTIIEIYRYTPYGALCTATGHMWDYGTRAIRITILLLREVNTQPTAPKSVLTECTPLCYP